jgi:hypothetical protein
MAMLDSKTSNTVTWAPSAPKVAIVIPAYNEARFIGSIALEAGEYGLVLVVDDGSCDRTAQIASHAGALVLQHEVNRGKGAALSTGFRYVKTLEPDVVVTIDGDGQHSCAEIPKLIVPILSGAADLVVGSRFLSQKNRIPRWRIIGQHALTLATNLSSGARLTDSQSGFRAFSASILQCMNFDASNFSVESEMQFLARDRQLRITEIPISCIYEEPPKRDPVKQAMQVISGIIQLVSRHRPLLFFGGGGFLVLLVGLGWGAYVVDIYTRLHQLAVGYTLISVLLSIIGSSALFTGLMLNSVLGLMLELKKTLERLQISG